MCRCEAARSVEGVPEREETPVETYVILRRGGWWTPEELQAANVRASEQGDKTPDDIRWIRSYVLAEPGGELGTVCVYEASSPEAIRVHAYRAGLPVDEIVAVTDTVVMRPDGAAAAAY
jgi:hypothetical protein